MKIPGKNLKTRSIWIVSAVAVFTGSATLLYPATHAHKSLGTQEKESGRAGAGDQSTSLNDQTELNVTVYNSNIALVRDVRQLVLPNGAFRLKFMDIAATVNPATVHFRSLNDPEKLGVIEQNYEYDLLEPAKLLHKYVGKEVTLVRAYQENGTTKREEIRATLLSDNNGPVWKIGNDIVTGMFAESYRFPEVPANLYERPTLLMSLENFGAKKQQVEASYLANNLSWNADYVLAVARDDKNADLDGWVTVINNSGTGFHNAHLELVAGELNRVQPPAAINGQSSYYRNQQAPGAPLKDPVMVYYKFKNEEKNGLGIPLPAGNVRVYQKDSKGGILFAGEDRIDHTPKDEFVNIHIGNAFDVVAEHKQTDYKRIDTHVWEMEFEVTLRNHKDAPVTVQVNEPIGGDWDMLSSTYKYTKTAAFAAQFNVPVAKNGTSVLKYRIRAKW